MRAMFALLPLLAACAGSGADAPVATEQGTRALLTATPLTCAQEEAVWTSFFGADGAYAYEFEGDRVAGRWRMDGPARLCTTDEAMPEEQCFALTPAPRAVTMTRATGESFQCRPA
jgi:hypothetical protein